MSEIVIMKRSVNIGWHVLLWSCLINNELDEVWSQYYNSLLQICPTLEMSKYCIIMMNNDQKIYFMIIIIYQQFNMYHYHLGIM